MNLHDDDGRRYGDWQKKDLRKSAQDIQGDVDPNPWYRQNFWMIVLILVFWPIGLYLCWTSTWPLPAKIGASAFVAFTVAAMWWFNFGQAAV